MSSLAKIVLAAGAAALLVTGCGSTNDNPEPVQTTTVTASAEAQPSAEQTDTSQPASAAGLEAGYAAIDLALAEAGGGIASELDLNSDGSWDVDVINGATKIEFEISADGSSVLKREDESADEKDQNRAAAVKVQLKDAIDTAMANYPGEFDEAELDDHNDVIVWEIDLDDDDIYVDVATGEIIS